MDYTFAISLALITRACLIEKGVRSVWVVGFRVTQHEKWQDHYQRKQILLFWTYLILQIFEPSLFIPDTFAFLNYFNQVRPFIWFILSDMLI